VNTVPGKLIVIEAIDGGGTETQSKMLLDYLKNKNISAERICYPDYEQPIGKLIHEYLHRKFELSPAVQVLLHIADFTKDAVRIKQWLEEGKMVIADRYITTTIAYQGFRFPVEKIINLADIFELPKPDAIVYLKISAETSIKRKLKEKDELDRNESNKEFLEQLGKFYLKLIEKNVFGKWVVVDGEKSKEEVFEEVKKALDL